MSPKIITRTVLILSLISLFTDVASEMLYPVMPVFLESIGFSFLLIGILEGVAEATSGLSKSYFGKISDRTGKRLPFIRIGYAMSALAKPLMAAFTYPFWIFGFRTTDRLGKGIRTSARDALLGDESTPETRGRVFGFHRSMDTLGAVIGPSIALVFLYFFPGKYRILFLVAFVPGLAAIISTFLVREKKKPAEDVPAGPPVKFFALFSYWKRAPANYRRLAVGLLIFALFNSSDFFLLLKVKNMGTPDTWVIGLYIFYNLIYAIFSWPSGVLADKFGMKKVLVFGLVIFSFVYAGFSFNSGFSGFMILFLLYGLYAATTEGISKAWITNMVGKAETASAIGTYTGLQSFCALAASSLTGLLWMTAGPKFTFLLTSLITLAVAGYLIILPADRNPEVKE
ncbi:MAG: MFS transporter [Bacteroidota bacterium]|nr:MFS transporter [Bacteroidota bacterium]